MDSKNRENSFSVALMHYPVLDRSKQQVTTNITNFDVHDIARVCKVYGVDHYFIVHPAKEQLMFVARLLDHWRVGQGSKLNPMRKTALDQVQPVENLDEIRKLMGPELQIIGTSARNLDIPKISFQETKLLTQSKPCLLIFGTGFGLSEEILRSCDYLLEPLRGAPPLDYRHLSVRSAVSICLDRLFGA